MKKTLIVGLTGIVLLTAASCRCPENQDVSCVETYKDKQLLETKVKALESSRDAQGQLADELTDALRAADRALADLDRSEPDLQMARREIESQEAASESRREVILRRIEGLKARLTSAQHLLAAQQKQYAPLLKLNTIAQTALAGRERELRAKVQRIVELEKELKIASEKLIVTEGSLAQKDVEIEKERKRNQVIENENGELRSALYTGYYVVMSEDDLVTAGIVSKNRFLWRSSLRLAELNASKFESFDISTREEIELEYPRDRLRVVSQHPPSSYAIDATGKNASTLRVIERDAFWATRFLIIAVKRR
jgi:chromosome segregation ATPase